MPVGTPDLTRRFIAFLFSAPFFLSCSERVMRHSMHQQPPHAPFLPNSCSKSFQRSMVSGLNVYLKSACPSDRVTLG